MTLVVSLQNSAYTIQVSDRRVSRASLRGRFIPINDEWNKAGVLTTSDARLAYGYSGIATFGFSKFQTWLRRALLICAEPDYLAVPTIERLAKYATDEFNSRRLLRLLPASLFPSQICFSGFLYSQGYPRSVYAVVTNTGANVPLKELHGPNGFGFQIWYQDMRRKEPFVSVQRIGNWPALGEPNELRFEEMLRAGLPPEAIRGKAFEVMKEVSASARSYNNIGAQISSITIPSDRFAEIHLGYRSDRITNRRFNPDIVIAEGAHHRKWYSFDLTSTDSVRPALVPKVRSKQPCPCGSGKKYKHCHGKNRAYR